MAAPEVLLPFDSRDEQFAIDGVRLQEGTGTRSNHLPAKAAYIISTSATDPDIKEVLLVFDSIIENNNADNRRRLRAQILQELAGSNSQVVQNFGLIAAQVDNIGNALKVLHTNFNDITKRVDVGTFEINAAIHESDTTLAERQRLNSKEIVLHAFLEKFTLPVAHLANITSSPQSLDDEFFDTLDRVKGIHSDCQILLGSESTRAGVDIMDQMTKNLNSAYQKVYLWLQREVKFLSFETPVGNRQVRKALEVLTNRPALLQSCIDTLAEARQRSLHDSFNTALTGGDGGALGTKPIDMMAHDPIRYTGDMLAWLHSALVGELEALQAIFELPPNTGRTNGTIEGEIRIPLDSELPLRDHVRPLADKSLETALSTFRFRTEHVISSHEEPTLLYSLLNILTFYRETFKKLVGVDVLLVTCVDSLISTATRQLQSCLRDLVRSVQQDVPSATSDLSPPVFLLDALGRFKALIKSFEGSLISESYKPQAFDMIFSEALKPYTQGCEALSNDLPSPSSHIFMVNCLEVSKNTLRLSPYGTENYIHFLEDSVDHHVASIVSHLHNHFLEASGLSMILRMEDVSNKSLDPKCITRDALSECSKQLDGFLPTALIDAESQLLYLSRPSLRKSIIRSGLDEFVTDFTIIETTLAGLPETVFSKEWFPRTTEEVQILLG